MTNRSDSKSGVGTDRGPRLRIQEGYVKKGDRIRPTKSLRDPVALLP